MIFLLTVASLLIQIAYCSSGDSSPYFEKCVEKCQLLNCSKDGSGFLSTTPYQPLHLKLFLWDCESECKYECMWKTTHAFLERKWKVPQFFGKWPFVRVLGVQEPASFIFSVLNLYYHVVGLKAFRKRVKPESPFYWRWQINGAISMHAWVWSCIFHCRDFLFTEYMDYTFAFSLILSTSYFSLGRVLYGIPRFLNILVTTFYLAFFVNHVIYLTVAKVDYGYNMTLNVTIGAVTVLCMFLWSFWNRKEQPYLWKCAAYFTLTALVTSLELIDFPPILWTFDSHALWHLGTAIINPLFYGFMIEDCNYLRKLNLYQQKQF